MSDSVLTVDCLSYDKEKICISNPNLYHSFLCFSTNPTISISPKGIITFRENVHKNNLDETALEFIKIVEKMSVDRQHNSIIIESYSNENDVRCMSSGNNIRITYGDIAISSEDERSKNKNLKKCLLELCERLC
jgi:hypothetical protein